METRKIQNTLCVRANNSKINTKYQYKMSHYELHEDTLMIHLSTE